MRYQVPQFIDVEDKIFGPLTLKQFLYVAGGSGFAFIIWSLLPTYLAIPIALPILGFFIGLAFYKVNGKPMVEIVESAFKYLFSPKLYLWRKTPRKPEKKSQGSPYKSLDVPKISGSKLRDLSWGLDIKETIEE